MGEIRLLLVHNLVWRKTFESERWCTVYEVVDRSPSFCCESQIVKNPSSSAYGDGELSELPYSPFNTSILLLYAGCRKARLRSDALTVGDDLFVVKFAAIRMPFADVRVDEPHMPLYDKKDGICVFGGGKIYVRVAGTAF